MLRARKETAALAEKEEPEKMMFKVKSDKNGRLEFSLPQSENQVDFVRIDI